MGRSVRCAVLLAISSLVSACGGGGNVDGPTVLPLLPDRVLAWNQIALDAILIDHTPNLPQLPGSNVPGANAGSQRGPTRTGRAMAIVHAAIYDAVNAIDQGHTPYLVQTPYAGTASIDAAIAQAAHDTLVALWPQQLARFDAALAADLALIPDGVQETLGVEAGAEAADTILAARQYDGSSVEYPGNSPYTAGTLPGRHRADPINPGQGYLTPRWGEVDPFGVSSYLPFSPPPPPALNSPEYTAAFNEVKTLGGDGITTPTTRTADQTQIGLFWAYDGAAGLGVPNRLYNQIARTIAVQEGNSVVENARYFFLVNVALADAISACFFTKYVEDLWRPVIGIRESDPGTGPTGLGDGNPNTVGDPTWTPLGSPSTNTDANNFTPNFPSYSAGHATFGGALFQMLIDYYGRADIAFTFTSDELNGVNRENSSGSPRPLAPRSYTNLRQAEQENADSRVYLGVHWRFDETDGDLQGRGVANEVFAKLARPR